MKARCSECGGTRVQELVWYDVNADKVVDGDACCGTPQTFCPDCAQEGRDPHPGIEYVEKPPACGHSACRQHWIDSGSGECVAEDR